MRKRSLWQQLTTALVVGSFLLLSPVRIVGLETASETNRPEEAVQASAPSLKYRPTSEYRVQHLQGWKLYVAPDLLEDQELTQRVFAELEKQLKQITEAVPPEALKKIMQVPIWIEKKEGHHPCMAYHPDPEWLRHHDMNPDKAKCVEIANGRNFVNWSRTQPWMVLHELAHAYHDQFLPGGFGNRQLRQRFDEVKKEALYQKVKHVNGREQEAYALKNVMEFFAENSEAFFGKNDFYPFTRDDLEKYDPKTYALVAAMWGVSVSSTPEKPEEKTVQTEAREENQSHGSQ
ncbi:MAG: hypothetical protein H5U08_16460 [Thermogutta sp.]|uniref:hypothetical protein n=1 Tax=Thermogutta sp. TaxID=1962930 RepID=UPI00198EDF77|nr:hypothetical protein [Thermogutta sp.]MBC7353953.1 hypothetical protein [Thermogutta sp.]